MDSHPQGGGGGGAAHSVLVQGEVLSGRRLEAYAAKWGLCGICAATKTHQRMSGISIFNKTCYEPLTRKNEQTGQYTVYKGYCLQPTCYTLVEAQEMLGERSSSSILSAASPKNSSSSNNKRKIATRRSTSNNSGSSSHSGTTKKKPQTSSSNSSSKDPISRGIVINSPSSANSNNLWSSSSSGLDLLSGAAAASESSLHLSTGDLTISPQMQKAASLRQRLHASYPGPVSSAASSRGLLLSPSVSPEPSEGTKSVIVSPRRTSAASSHSNSSRGGFASPKQPIVHVGIPISLPPSIVPSLSPRKKTSRHQSLGVPQPPPPPPYGASCDKRAAPVYRLSNGPLVTRSTTADIHVSPNTTPTTPADRELARVKKEIKVAFADEGTKNSSGSGGGNWDRTVYRPPSPDDLNLSAFSPIAKGVQQQRRSSLPATSPTSFVEQELEAAFALGNVPLIVEILQRRRSVLDQETASRALEYLRRSLVAVQRSEKVIIYYPEMATIICDILRNQFVADVTTTITRDQGSDQVDVASQGVLTLMSMAAVSTDYARDIWASNGADVILALLAKQTQQRRMSSDAAVAIVLQERCAAALEVLTGTAIDIIPEDLDFAEDVAMMGRLVDVLISQLMFPDDDSSCPSHALRALHNLLSCKWPSNLNLWDKMSEPLRDKTELLWEMLESKDIAEVVDETIMFLLGRLNQTSDEVTVLSPTQLNLLMALLRKDRSFSLHMAVLVFMTTTNVPDGNAATIVARVCKTTKLYEANVSIHQVGTDLLYILLQQTEDVLQPAIVKKLASTIVKTMKAFPNEMSIQQSTCGILADLGEGETGRHFVLPRAGVEAIVHAFQELFTRNAPTSAKQAVTRVLERLSRQSMSTMETEPCILLLVEKALRVESDLEVKGSLLRLVQDLVQIMLPNRDDFSTSVPTSNLIDCILDMLHQHQDSPQHALQCYVLLAAIYRSVHFTPGGQDGQSTILQLWQARVRLRTHSTKEFDVLWCTISSNIHDASILTACCCALSNYLSPLCAVLGTVTDDAALEQALGERELRISSLMLQVLHGAMLQHKANADLQGHAMELLRVLVMLTKADVLNEWVAAIASTVAESMENFSCNDNIESIGQNIFATLLQKTQNSALLSSRGCLRVIVRGLLSDSEVTVLQSSWLLVELLTNDSSAGHYFRETTDVFSSIVGCMITHGASSEVQRQCCVILKKGIAGSQHHVHHIANGGGLEAIANALERHSGLVALVEPACWLLLKILAEVDDDNALWAHRRLLGRAVVSAMKHSARNVVAEKAIAIVWLRLSAKKDYLKAELIDSVPVLLKAMKVNLDDLSFQTCACCIIKMFCNFGEGMKLAGPMGAIDSILDALLAHGDDSASLVIEALAALKILVAEEPGRTLFKPLEISEIIRCFARIHLDNPQVQRQALTALNHSAVVLHDPVLEYLIQVMRKHPTDECVQTRACLFLKSYMSHSTSCDKIRKQSHRLHDPLSNATEMFWETCGELAMDISDQIMEN